jgi:methyl-accepting chemotaxis protein
MKKLRESIRGKLLLTFLAIALIPLATATLAAVFKTRATLAERIGLDRATIASQIANAMDRAIYERALDVQGLGSAPELALATMGMADEGSVRSVLAEAVRRSGLLSAVRAYDQAGGIIAASSEEEMARGAKGGSGEEWFTRSVAANAPTYIGPVLKDANGRLIVRVASAIRSADGSTLGVVVADLDWEQASKSVLGAIENEFHRLGNETVRTYVVDAAGMVVASTTTAEVLSASVAKSAALAGIESGQQGSAIEPLFGGPERLAGYAPMNNGGDNAGWYRGFMDGKAGILVVEDSKAAFADATSLMTFLIVLALVVAALVAGIAWFVTGQIADPLVKVVAMIQELGRGHLSQRVDVRREDEIGTLARAMNDFADELQNGVVRVLYRFADGDLAYEKGANDEHDEISPPLARISESLRGLIRETGTLTEAALDGRLGVRGNAAAFQGAYRELVDGINAMLDAVVAPINEASVVLEQTASRDLTARMTGDYKGDFAKLKLSLNLAVDNLEAALLEVSSNAEQVASSSAQITEGSQVLAEGAAEQASSLEEISSSLQELSSMTRQNAANAREARSLSEGARSSANRGVESMRRLSGAVERIKESSGATAKIVRTIDEIAFQTNLLALNAAVEAARAGEAGKGFAVVAEEVRNLAMRSAEAARNTAALIEEGVKNADGGVVLNREVLENLEEIAGQVDRVGEVMAEIAAASEQQSQGVEQINSAVEQMNSLTQQTAANAQESANAAEDLSGQADQMRELIAGFALGEEARTEAKAAPRAAEREPVRSRPQPAPARGAGAPADSKRAKHAGATKARVAAGASKRAKQKNGKRSGNEADPARLIPFDDDDSSVLGEF